MNLRYKHRLIAVLSFSFILCTGCTGLSGKTMELVENRGNAERAMDSDDFSIFPSQSPDFTNDSDSHNALEQNNNSEEPVLCLPLSGTGWDAAGVAGDNDKTVENMIICGSAWQITDNGDVILTINPDELDSMGYDPGDITKVTIDDVSAYMPYVPKKSDVDDGKNALYEKEGRLVLGTNKGCFAEGFGIAVYDDDETSWIVSGGRDLSEIDIRISIKERQGYKDGYEARELIRNDLYRSMNRGDYNSDEEFANFRPVKGGVIKSNWVFRCSSPVNDELKRSVYADRLVSANSINSIVNMADSNERIEGFLAEGNNKAPYYKKLYAEGNVFPMDMGMKFNSRENNEKIAEGVRFINKTDGPYLIHCKEGKDRTGLFCILLEAFMGASFDEMRDDYMESYTNYFSVEPGSPEYALIQNGVFIDLLSIATKTEKQDINGVRLSAGAESEGYQVLAESPDFSKGAEEFLHDIGLSDEECATLKKRLSGK